MSLIEIRFFINGQFLGQCNFFQDPQDFLPRQPAKTAFQGSLLRLPNKTACQDRLPRHAPAIYVSPKMQQFLSTKKCLKKLDIIYSSFVNPPTGYAWTSLEMDNLAFEKFENAVFFKIFQFPFNE